MSTPKETLVQIGQADPEASGPDPARSFEFCHAVLSSGDLFRDLVEAECEP